MKFIIKIIGIFFFALTTVTNANENYFNKAKGLFDKGKYEESKFLFQRSIVFNPKHSKSYLYLAKIYKVESEYIIITENSIYLISADVDTKRIS